MEYRICEVARCHREAPRGARLCRGCVQALAGDLSRLPGLYDECGRLLGGSDPRAAVGRTSGGPMPGLPFNTTAADAREAVRGVLGSWCGLVAEERRVTRPRRTAAELARFLTRHLDWLRAHETAAEFAQEIARLVRTTRRVTRSDRRRRIPVGACVEAGCPGDLVALVASDGPAASDGSAALDGSAAAPQESPGEIVCSADAAHRWAAHEWLHLSRHLDRPEAPSEEAAPAPLKTRSAWLTATEVACLWRLPTGSVYRLASEHEWNRRSRSGRTYYDTADVERTFAKRAAKSL
ncbi:hypothetical protein [Actinomadura terrae]|uniref:hypothetical protein n=1 Tax=Actinomadura terrae TaxID=604353 RepID=UPI001FA810FB|nr:hypothetical protein [Actinomadura terrae]